MIEQFAFIIKNQTLPFADLRMNHGLVFKGMEQSAYASWNLATSKNPYIDGLQVNNRSANARELTIEFRYTMQKAPDEADAALFEFLSTSEDGTVTIKKSKGNDNKFITATIQEINHPVYTDTPYLQIVLLADAFWRGEKIDVDISKLSKAVQAGVSTTFYLENYKFKGEVQTGFDLYVKYESNPTQFDGYLGGYFFGKYFRLNFDAKALPFQTAPSIEYLGTTVSSYEVHIEMYRNMKCFRQNFGKSGLVSWEMNRENLISGLDENSHMAKLMPNQTNGGYFIVDGVTGDNISGIKSDFEASVHLSYIPLYIR